MGSWSRCRQKRQDIRFLGCLLVVQIFGASCATAIDSQRDCPSAIVTDGTPLQIVSRQNHTREVHAVCGASLETICFRKPEWVKCQVLLNLSVNVAEGGQMVEFHLLQAKPISGWRRDVFCNLPDLTNNFSSSDQMRNVNFWLKYDCCDEEEMEKLYFARLLVHYSKSGSCEAKGSVKLKPKSEEVFSPVKTVMGKSGENTSAERSRTVDDDPPRKAVSLTGVVVAVAIAVVGAIVAIVVVYIVCVKCSDGRHSYGRANSQSEEAPLQTEPPDNCPYCDREKANVVAPEHSVSCSTINISIIPTITFSSSDEEIAEEVLDSGCYVSTDVRNIVREYI